MSLQATMNYLVPASGTTSGFDVSQVFSATPVNIDWRTIGLDGKPFVPSGVFIDNTLGTGAIRIVINENGFVVQCPAGAAIQTQYPAPLGQSVSITGLGQATVVFVDFPVIPFVTPGTGGTATATTIADGSDVALGALADAAVTNPAAAASVIALLKGVLTNQDSLSEKFTAPPATGTVSNFGLTVVSQIMLPANAGRQGAVFVNDGPNICYLLLTTTGPAAANTCTVILPAGGSFVLNKGDYTGNVHGIGNAAGGTIRITEFTA